MFDGDWFLASSKAMAVPKITISSGERFVIFCYMMRCGGALNGGGF